MREIGGWTTIIVQMTLVGRLASFVVCIVLNVVPPAAAAGNHLLRVGINCQEAQLQPVCLKQTACYFSVTLKLSFR